MQVGDLVRMRGGLPALGIVLRQCNGEVKGYSGFTGTRPTIRRVEVCWIEDGEASWEPKKWLEVISER